MLSSRNELFAVGALIAYLAFVPSSMGWTGNLLCSPIGKVISLATIIYVHKKVSCSLALLLVIAYLRCSSSAWEGFTTPTTTVAPTPTCPDGYALDAISNTCKTVSAAAGSIPPSSSGSLPGASVTTPPPNSAVSTAPMTTPTATMPPVNAPMTMGGVQPSTSSASTVAPV